MSEPTTIGHYRMADSLGQGMFASVFEAVDERFDQRIAVKILADNHSRNPDLRTRFITEARVLRRSRNRHVIRVHDLGETDAGQLYMVLDLCSGGTLHDRVHEARAGGWRPTTEDVLGVARALGSGLASLHESQCVHRDLNPRNLLIAGATAEDRPADQLLAATECLVISDLGLAKDLAVASGLTVGAGTSGFSAPEQEGGPSIVDERADVFAASAVLRWLLDGERLTGAEGLGAVLQRGLSADPADRQPSISRWLSEIELSLASARSGPSSTTTRQRFRVWRAVAGAAVALIVAVVFLVAGRALDDGGDEITDLGDGRRSAIAEFGDLTVTITGPSEVTVGEPANFVVDVDGAESWVVVTPEGRVLASAESLEVRALSAGAAEIGVIVPVDGRSATLELPFEAAD